MPLENNEKQTVDREKLYDKYCQKQDFRRETNYNLFSDTPNVKEDIWFWGAFANEKIITHIKNNEGKEEEKEAKILLYKKLAEDFSFLHEILPNSNKIEKEKKKLENIYRALTQKNKEELEDAIDELTEDLKTLDEQLEQEKSNKEEQEKMLKDIKEKSKEKSNKNSIEEIMISVGEILQKQKEKQT